MPVLDEVKVQTKKSAKQASFRATPGKLIGATDAVGNSSLPAFAKPSQEYSHQAAPSWMGAEPIEVEDTLGCVRGVLWSIIFEAALAAGALLYWKFHFFAH